MDEYNDIDDNEIDDLENENDNAEADGNVEQQQAPIAAVAAPEPPIVENIGPDDPDVIPDDETEATKTREGRVRLQPERLTYDRLGATNHQVQDGDRKKKVSFEDSRYRLSLIHI